MPQGRFEITSRLPVSAEAVWTRVTTLEGINDELRPWLAMSAPRGLDALDAERLPIGEPLGRSWIRAFGVVPVDYDDLRLERIDPPRGFLERSSTSLQRLWEHERTIAADGDGCLITDRLRWVPRRWAPARLAAPVYRAVFRHRHRRLARWAASVSAPARR